MQDSFLLVLDFPLRGGIILNTDSNQVQPGGSEMLTVGQFSKICQVSTKTLHHYDKIGLVKPEQTDKFTGYRYYSEEQLPLMLLIQRLKRYGFTLTEIKNFLGCEDKDVLYQKLKDKKLELER